MSNFDFNEKTDLMPSLFIGHGSPMNALEINEFTKSLKILGEKIKPKAVLAISAHWLDLNTTFQNAADQKTIHDFYGFPKELYDLKYPAHGWAEDLTKYIEDLGIPGAQFTEKRGLDHGTWMVLTHMYPNADIPVIQLSMQQGLPLHKYFVIGQKLSELRKRGILILGSGNIVHNLHKINWDMQASPFEWAIEFDKKVEACINSHSFEKLLSIDTDEKDLFHLAHPTIEHYIPLAYVLGTARRNDRSSYPCSFIQNGSISMRSVLFT